MEFGGKEIGGEGEEDEGSGPCRSNHDGASPEEDQKFVGRPYKLHLDLVSTL